VKRGPHAKKFASPTAKAEAHTAQRLFAAAMIEAGLLSWDALRKWCRAQKAGSPSNTTPGRVEPEKAA
jgi:hypothetical protein